MILFVKYYLIRLKYPFEITRFPLFQNVNGNFFGLKYEQTARSFQIFLAELRKEKSTGNSECVDQLPKELKPHSTQVNKTST